MVILVIVSAASPTSVKVMVTVAVLPGAMVKVAGSVVVAEVRVVAGGASSVTGLPSGSTAYE